MHQMDLHTRVFWHVSMCWGCWFGVQRSSREVSVCLMFQPQKRSSVSCWMDTVHSVSRRETGISWDSGKKDKQKNRNMKRSIWVNGFGVGQERTWAFRIMDSFFCTLMQEQKFTLLLSRTLIQLTIADNFLSSSPFLVLKDWILLFTPNAEITKLLPHYYVSVGTVLKMNKSTFPVPIVFFILSQMRINWGCSCVVVWRMNACFVCKAFVLFFLT